MQLLGLAGRPLRKQDCSGIFPAKEGTKGLFESATEQHRRTGVLLLPAVKRAMPVAPRAGEILADLGVAVGHSGHLWIVQVCWGKFFPSTSGSKTVQSDQGRTVEDDVTDLDHPHQPNELSLVHLVASEQLDVVAEVAQEPVQLPQCFCGAIESARQDVAKKPVGLKNGQSQRVVRFLSLPTKLGSLYPNQEDPVRNVVRGTTIGG